MTAANIDGSDDPAWTVRFADNESIQIAITSFGYYGNRLSVESFLEKIEQQMSNSHRP